MEAEKPIESSPDSMTDPMLGRTLGGYRIVRKIAQGGMGAVYEAAHATLGRRAAIKVLLRELSSDMLHAGPGKMGGRGMGGGGRGRGRGAL